MNNDEKFEIEIDTVQWEEDPSWGPVTPKSNLITLTRALGLKRRRIEVWGQREVQSSHQQVVLIAQCLSSGPARCSEDVLWLERASRFSWGDCSWFRTALDSPPSGKCSLQPALLSLESKKTACLGWWLGTLGCLLGPADSPWMIVMPTTEVNRDPAEKETGTKSSRDARLSICFQWPE